MLCLRLVLVVIALRCVSAGGLDPALFGDLRWRMIGPFRGGRTVGIAGIPDMPNVFYMAANDGGIWKTTDYGRVWLPIFDEQPTGSIGSLALAPSNPSIIYAGSGEGLHRPDLSVGDGLYKSADGGRSWEHLGLRDAQQIASILVDPNDPNRVFAAALGHPYGPNTERGIFRSLDGGHTWQKVLYKNDNTGGVDLAFDPRNARTVYAVLWESREGPWENGSWQGPGSGLFKSIDGGDTWTQLSGGLPNFEQGLGRIGIGISPSDPNRMYALVDALPDYGGLYRSDDAGSTWRRVNHEERVWGRGSDFAWVRVDPRNPDKIYVANTSTYRSDDAGQTFLGWKGAPGGDDYHSIWINPNNPDIILLGVDQGATITVNGGRTWSSWYNQPTAQMYHVSTDNQFPYWVYGGQQESGSAAVASRGKYGAVTAWDWHPVGVEEYGFVAPDPLNPGIIFGGKATRYDSATGQTQEVGPLVLRGAKYRFLRSQPLLFSPVDPHVLFLAGNVLFKTANGGHSWEEISPDLTRKSYDVPGSVGAFSEQARKQATQRGVVYALAPSYKDVNVIWAGTDDGLIQVTRDGGKNWKDVTPPGLTPFSKISILDASHFDDNTVYAAVNRLRLDDLHPHIYRTHDGGSTWQEIVDGLPDDPINAVREDPVRKGLLYAGSERAVSVSFDDGAHWQSLRLNMPATSVRDLVVHGDDLVIGTHGRGFWILDDVTPLRQLTASVTANLTQGEAHLFQPALAYRVRRDVYPDTPLPPEEPAGQNPPDGAILDYYLGAATSSPVTLEILDAAGKLVRKYSSDDKPDVTEEELAKELTVPLYWVRWPRILPGEAGMHRFIWDLRYAPPPSLSYEYPISAIYRDTPREPLGVLVLPGLYTVRLTVNGKPQTQTLRVKMDPRVPTPMAGLQEQFAIASRLTSGMTQAYAALQEVKAALEKTTDPARKDALAALEGSGGGRRRRGGDDSSFSSWLGDSLSLYQVIEGADAAPTSQAAAAAASLDRTLRTLLAEQKSIESLGAPGRH
jgi:photosystem II stability/assembly factor-like uncharacterized protein